MKNNKGFSLVELIIVIAIMAILVGVMAPQLIKYIEKSNVSADTQLADTLHSAVVTSIMDPEVIAATDTSTLYSSLTAAAGYDARGLGTTDTLGRSICDILGITGGGEISTSLKSNGAASVMVKVENNKVSVWLPGTDSRGSKSGSGTTYAIGVY